MCLTTKKEKPSCSEKKDELLELVELTNEFSYDKNSIEVWHDDLADKMKKLKDRLNFQIYKITNNQFENEEEKQKIANQIKSLNTSLLNKQAEYDEATLALSNITNSLETQTNKIKEKIDGLEGCKTK